MQTTCDECKGTGQVAAFDGDDWQDRQAAGQTDDCPWCGGTGTVAVAYSVSIHGHNGDNGFTELWDVKPALASARKLAEKIMKVERHKHLHNGAPTVRWVEITGPGIEESLGLEEQDGRLTWSGNYTEPAPAGRKEATMATTTTESFNVSDLLNGLEGFTTEANPKGRYYRVQHDGRTVAYARPVKDGVSLKVPAQEGMPQRFANVLTVKGDNARMRVSAKNVKTAQALLERLAKQAKQG